MAAPAAINQGGKRSHMLKTARDFADYLLPRNPFIEMLGVSGSLSNPDSTEHDDIDFFVIAQRDKVWDCFTICLLTGWLYFRKIQKSRTFLCFNYLIDKTAAVGEIKCDRQASREYLNLIVLRGQAKYREILAQKKDIKHFYPLEYEKRISEQLQEKQQSSHSFQRAVLLLKPAVIVSAKLLEKQRKKRYAQRPGYTTRKIYSNTKVIRSNFY